MTASHELTSFIDSRQARNTRIIRGSLVLVALCVVFGIVEMLQQHIGNIARGDGGSLLYPAMYNLLPWLPVLPTLPFIVLLAERWPLDQARWKSYCKLQRELVALEIKLDARAKSERRKEMRRWERSRRRDAW